MKGFNNGRDTTDGVGGSKAIDQLAIDIIAGEKQCNLPVVTPRYFYVVEPNEDEGLDQLSIGMTSLELAKDFKNCECRKKTNPNAFIVCTFNEG